MHVAILGAPQTGKTQLTLALMQALNTQGAVVRVTDDAPLQQLQHHDLILLCGLDLTAATLAQLQADQAIRQALQADGRSFQVVYGQGTARVANALFGLAQQARAKGFTELEGQIRQPPVVRWSGPCENCGDGDCEHQLFSRLLAKPD